MSNPTKDQKTALDAFNQISDVLAVPTMAMPLPVNRQWTLPDLPTDEESSAGNSSPRPKEQTASVQATSASEESKTSESQVKNSPKQTGRK